MATNKQNVAKAQLISAKAKLAQAKASVAEFAAVLDNAKQDLRNWYVRHGAPTDPADNSDPRFDYLSPMTFSNYLTSVRGFHPAVADFYDRYAVDALAGLCSQVSAYTSISFIAAEYNPEFAYPGGNSGMLRKIVKWLVRLRIRVALPRARGR